jgi:ABC-2 type transport system permease protein
MNQVTTLMALFQRESWEHPNLIWRLPVGLVILNVVLAIASVSLGLQYFGTENFKFEFNSQDLSFDQGGPGQAAATFFLLSYFLLSQMVAIGYLLSALYEERKDRSILFWKSLPVSDFQVVLSKALMGLVVIPGLYLLAAMLTFMLVTVVLSLGMTFLLPGTALFDGFLMAGLAVVGEALRVFALQIIWGAPVFLWVLLVSGLARGQPLIWAMGIPLLVLVVEKSLLSEARVFDWFYAHATPLPFAGAWNPMMGSASIDLADGFLAAGIGLILFVLTVFGRRHFHEI